MGSLIRRHLDTAGVVRGPLKRSERLVFMRPAPFGPVRLVVRGPVRRRRGHHLTGAVASPVVVVVDEGGDLPAGLVLGGEVPAGQQFVLEGRVEALGGGVVERRADTAHRLDGPESGAGVGEHVAGVLAALVRMEHDTADLPAPYRRRHAQGVPSQWGVVVGSYGEPGQTPR